MLLLPQPRRHRADRGPDQGDRRRGARCRAAPTTTASRSSGPACRPTISSSPFPNDKAARAANNGALPPDQSLIVKAREDGADYIYALLNGYVDPPAGREDAATGMYYNKYFPGHQIAMPQPLHDDHVTYADGTKATLDQEAHDVVTS